MTRPAPPRACRLRRGLLALALVLLPAAAPAALLRVSGLVDPGVLGDGALSLSEAIRLATGALPCCGGLSAAEQAQISGGTPGAGTADTILFDASAVDLLGNGTAEMLPPLTGGNDTIDGEGRVVLSGANADPTFVLWGIRVLSSGNTIAGLAFEDVPGSVVFVSPPGGGLVQGNRILSNRFTRSGFDAVRLVAAAIPARDAVVTGGHIDGTVIRGNTIETATPKNLVRGFPAGAINILSAYAAEPGSVSGAKITATTVEDNVIQDVYQGLFARAAVGAGTFTGNELANLVIRGNVFQRINDQSCYVGATNPDQSGSSADNLTRDVVISGNTFRGRVFDPEFPDLGGGPFVSGGFLANCGSPSGTPTSVRDVTVSVEISDNVVEDRAPYGIYVQASQSCGGAGGSLTQSLVQDVVIARNRVEASGTGVSLTGGSSYLTGPDLTNADNTMRNVAIVENTLTDNANAGIELIAGTSNGGASTRNVIEAVTIRDNTFTGGQVGVAATGGVTVGSGNGARGNAVRGLVVAANRIAGTSRVGILLQGVTATAGSTGIDNLVESPEVSGNVLEGVRGFGVQLFPGSVAGGADARDNTVRGALIAANTLVDTLAGGPDNPYGVGILLAARPGTALGPTTIADNVIDRVASFGIQLQKTNGHRVTGNVVTNFGVKPFVGKKKKNRIRGNSFGPKRKRA
jgi:hypothetical protein